MKSRVVIIVECGIVSKVILSPQLKDVEVVIQDYDVLDENAVNVVHDPAGDVCSLYPVEDIGDITDQEHEFIEQSLNH